MTNKKNTNWRVYWWDKCFNIFSQNVRQEILTKHENFFNTIIAELNNQVEQMQVMVIVNFHTTVYLENCAAATLTS